MNGAIDTRLTALFWGMRIVLYCKYNEFLTTKLSAAHESTNAGPRSHSCHFFLLRYQVGFEQFAWSDNRNIERERSKKKMKNGGELRERF
jgi:hypothetical protein